MNLHHIAKSQNAALIVKYQRKKQHSLKNLPLQKLVQKKYQKELHLKAKNQKKKVSIQSKKEQQKQQRVSQQQQNLLKQKSNQ